jgi:DNA invertase Pin-like site-specific DNA recombinase
MSDIGKVKPSHTQRAAFVYIRQSSPSQVENNKESTARQYALAGRARELGWPADQVTVIDEDLGISGASAANRSGFTRLITEVALGRVGIVLGLEVSRLARNSADWYRLIELCGVTDTLLGDNDGLYHPALFNDRLILGVKGTMSEMELHVLRAQLDGGVRNKAARGELQRGLPVGLVWGERGGEVLFDPDEAVTGAIRTVFDRFAEFGSARKVWLWFRSEGLSFPLRQWPKHPVRWVAPSYHAIHQVLTNPVYAGAYVYGRTRQERYVDENGAVRKRIRRLPMEQWSVLLVNHHAGFIDWATYQANQSRLASNTHPQPHEAGGGAVREGSALLQGMAVCGNCGRKLRTHYRGRNSTPGYHCAGKTVVEGRGLYCLNIGGVAIDEAVAGAFLNAVTPAAVEAVILTVKQLQAHHDAALAQWRLEVERARYEAERAERRYRAVEPENRLVARGLEKEWETQLRQFVRSGSRTSTPPATTSPSHRGAATRSHPHTGLRFAPGLE